MEATQKGPVFTKMDEETKMAGETKVTEQSPLEEQYDMYVCSVCCMTSYRKKNPSIMTVQTGDDNNYVCSMGCALRQHKFYMLINPEHSHDGFNDLDKDLFGYASCTCGCREMYDERYYNIHAGCGGGKGHATAGHVVPLTEDEVTDSSYGEHVKYKCIDCGTGLYEFEKRIIDRVFHGGE